MDQCAVHAAFHQGPMHALSWRQCCKFFKSGGEAVQLEMDNACLAHSTGKELGTDSISLLPQRVGAETFMARDAYMKFSRLDESAIEEIITPLNPTEVCSRTSP